MKKVLFIIFIALLCATHTDAQTRQKVEKEIKTYNLSDLQGLWVGRFALNNKGEWLDLEASISFGFTEYEPGNRNYAVVIVNDDTLIMPYSFDGANKIFIYYPEDYNDRFLSLEIKELKPKERMTADILLEGETKPTKIKFVYVEIQNE